MKRVYNEDPIALRKKAYEQRDSELLHAIADAFEYLHNSNIDIGLPMRNELQQRNQIKHMYKKTN